MTSPKQTQIPEQSQTVLVTGASAGIGSALAEVFAERGFQLVLTARRLPELEALAAKLRGSMIVIPADLATADGAAKLHQELIARGITIDVLVNNAGIGQYGEFSSANEAHLADMLQLNVVSLTRLTRLLLPGMIERRHGRILNVASIAAFMPGPLMSVYYATKAYVLSFSEGLRGELAGSGVTVSCLCPGPTKSEFVARANLEESKLFDSPGVMEAEPVARAGVEGLLRGKPIIIPGFRNRLIVLSTRFTPREVLLKIVKNLQARRRES